MIRSPRLPVDLAVRAHTSLKWSVSRPTNAALLSPRVGHGRRTACPAPIGLSWRIPYSTKPPTSTSTSTSSTPNSEKKLKPHPERVTATSTTTPPLLAPDQPDSQVDKKDAQDLLHGVKADLGTVKETFALTSVPRESYLLGLAGTLPYLGTSISTVYLAWNIRTQWPTSSGLLNSLMVSNETAHQWLGILEPIQLGYGALIISFLGAIHWGLEYAEKEPSHKRTRFRYGVGVLAPVVAWPTLMMPHHFGLIAQFAAFTGLYFVDARATTRGWAPPWYGTYRFVLTFIVGGAIFISLVGRAKIGDERARLSSDRLEETYAYKHNQQHSYAHWAKLEEEERERNRKAKQAEEKRKKEEEERKKKEEKKSKSKAKSDGKDSGKPSDKSGQKEAKVDAEAKEDSEGSEGGDNSNEQDADSSESEASTKDQDNQDGQDDSKDSKDSKDNN